jgi:hypothetical protein
MAEDRVFLSGNLVGLELRVGRAEGSDLDATEIVESLCLRVVIEDHSVRHVTKLAGDFAEREALPERRDVVHGLRRKLLLEAGYKQRSAFL